MFHKPASVRARRDLGVLLALSMLLACNNPAAAGLPYEPGQGFALPWRDTWAGGYATMRMFDPEHAPASLGLQDISLFLHGSPAPAWQFFAEFELGDTLEIDRDGASASLDDVDLERLYVEHNLGARNTLRIGKFLTPIGRWNTIHADPLVWSVTRPLSTSAPFARHASGVALFGERPLGEGAIEYHVFGDATDDLDASERHEEMFEDSGIEPAPPHAFSHATGLHLNYRNGADSFRLGASLARFGLRDSPQTWELAGADIYLARNGWEFNGEAVYRRADSGARRSESGAFAQLVAPLSEHLFVVGSAERFRSARFDRSTRWAAIGLAWRPRSPYTFKLEFRHSEGETRPLPGGLLLSAAILL